MNRVALLSFVLAALFVVVLVVDLIAQWTHYKRTAAVLVVLAVAAAAYGARNLNRESAS
jgi:hypothetical protein